MDPTEPIYNPPTYSVLTVIIVLLVGYVIYKLTERRDK
jgi:hypothetical protein